MNIVSTNSVSAKIVLKKCTRFLFACLIACLISKPAFAQKEIDATFEKLKEEYKVLINREPTDASKRQWTDLIVHFKAFTSTHTRTEPELAARAQFTVAVLCEQLASASISDAAAFRDSTVGSFERVAQDFPDTTIADDALLKAADYCRSHPEGCPDSEARAQSFEHTILARYPTSDSALRLKAEQEKTAPAGSHADSGQKKTLVVLDPGHGGEDFGAEGVSGILEKDLSLLVAIETQQKLQQLGIEALLTRKGDSFLPLKDRVQFANDNAASLFVSIHFNASLKGNVQGYESYYYGKSSDPTVARIAVLENKDAIPSDESESTAILGDMLGQLKVRESKVLADAMQRSIIANVRPHVPTLVTRPLKQAPLFVLEGTQMPALLLELGYIDNADEGSRMLEKEYRSMYASALAQGINAFVGK